MSSPVENLVQRLNAQRSGKGWKAKCPVHDDHTPSLSINEGADGRALLKCHAGCDNTAILAALDMSYRDLFPATYPHRQGSGEIPKAFAPATELPPAPAPYVPPPLALLPVELQEYVNAASEALNVDGSFIVLPMLSAIASAIGNTRTILLKPGF